MVYEKRCLDCKKRKPYTRFPRSTTAADGRKTRCKKCEEKININREGEIKAYCQVCNKRVFKGKKYCSYACSGLAKKLEPNSSGKKVCSICHEYKSLSFFYKHKNKINSYHATCKDCQKRRTSEYMRTDNGRYRTAMLKATKHRKNKRIWEITRPQFLEIIKKRCHYCGTKDLGEVGSGMDRKDNSKGYTIDNVVPCCKICNSVKTDAYSYEEMLEISVVLKKIRRDRLRRLKDRRKELLSRED